MRLTTKCIQMTAIAKYRAPWAVKSGGHASNPGFSSTTGVHVSLEMLDQVTLSADKSTVEIGFGLVRNDFKLVFMWSSPIWGGTTLDWGPLTARL